MISNKELISLVRDEVLETAKKLKADPSYPSTIISSMIWLYNKKIIDDSTILDHNNILGIKYDNGEFADFSTIQQGLILAYNDDNTVMPEEYNKEKKTICTSNKLYAIDKSYAYSMNNTVDLSAEQKKPNIDQYTVKSDIGSVLGKATTLDEAEKVAETSDKKTTIVNSMGDVVKTVSNSHMPKPISSSDATSLSLQAGSKIEVSGVNLYESSRSSSPSRLLSGTFYLYDGIDYFGKLAICVNPNPTSIKDIFGFINKNQL